MSRFDEPYSLGGEPAFLSERSSRERESIRIKRRPDESQQSGNGLRDGGKIVATIYENLSSYKEQLQANVNAGLNDGGSFFAEYCIGGKVQKSWPFDVTPTMQPTGFQVAQQPTNTMTYRNGNRPRNRMRTRRAHNNGVAGWAKEELHLARAERDRAFEREREALERERQAREQLSEEKTKRLIVESQSQRPSASLQDKALELAISSGDAELREAAISSIVGVRGDGEEGGSLWGVVKAAIENPEGAQNLLRTFAPVAGMLRPAQPQPQSVPAQSAPQSLSVEQQVLQTLSIVIADLKRGKRAGNAADEIENLLERQPTLQPQFDALLELDELQILAQLSQVAGEDLSTYRGACDFTTALKRELSDESEEDEEPPANVESNNGNQGAAAGVVQ